MYHPIPSIDKLPVLISISLPSSSSNCSDGGGGKNRLRRRKALVSLIKLRVGDDIRFRSLRDGRSGGASVGLIRFDKDDARAKTSAAAAADDDDEDLDRPVVVAS